MDYQNYQNWLQCILSSHIVLAIIKISSIIAMFSLVNALLIMV